MQKGDTAVQNWWKRQTFHLEVANSDDYSLFNPLLKFVFCGRYSVYKQLFYYARVPDIYLSNIWIAYTKLHNYHWHLENLNTVCNDQPNRS